MTVTLRDVARLTGVSVSTVSRVLNGSKLVNESTRRIVLRAIDSLGYQPSRVARRLRAEKGLANLIGVIIPDIQNPFFADVVRGVEDVARQHGYMVFLGNSDEDTRKERVYLDLMRAESVDGLILPPISEKDEAGSEIAQSGIPMVCVDRRLARVTVDTVVVDNVRGAYEAVEHLVRLGHRRIGFIGGRPEISTSRERFEGYTKALRDHGMEVDSSLARHGDSRQASGRRATEALLDLPQPPTAVFVGNNLMTLGSLEAIHLRDLRIPHDIAIVSYDDMPWALALDPPLTAVRQPGYEIGRQAMDLLLQRIKDPSRSTTLVVLQPELIVRKSCGTGMVSRAGDAHSRSRPPASGARPSVAEAAAAPAPT